MKKLLSIMLAFVMVCSLTVCVSANEVSEITIEEIDALLREANTPESEIEAMEDELKRMIYENTLSQGEVEYVAVEKEEVAENMARSINGYAISESDLRLSVTAFKVSGAEQVEIYPSYEWLVPVKPKGKDYFGYSTHSCYSAVAGARSNLIWYKLDEDDAWTSSGSATYTGSSLTGYEHQGSSLGTPDFEIYIKGNFYYKVDIDSTPVKKITLGYVHDTSWGGSYSYTVGYGPFTINVAPSSSNVGYLNNNFNLVY